MLYDSPRKLKDRSNTPPPLPLPDRVVLTTPDYFDVEYVINPHMSANVGTVQKEVARQQWKALRASYCALDIRPLIVEGEPDLPDMVFCANQTLPFYQPTTDRRGVVLSRMHADQRRAEVPHYEAFFAERGYDVETLPPDVTFEGMGDAIWHPNRFQLWGGYGFRSGIDAYDALDTLLDVDILLLKLQDSDYYHLDTCFCPLDANHVLIAPDAFDNTGRTLIEECFETVIEAPDGEARQQFACNAHCPDGTHVLIQEGCDRTARQLRNENFRPIALDTSEFLKAGGSVFCLKQMIW